MKTEKVARLQQNEERVERVRVVSPYDGLADNNLGNGLEIESGDEAIVLKMHGRDDMPTVVSVSCGFRLVSPNEPTPVDVAPVGVIKYGTGGANNEIEFDLLSSMVLNVPATSFDLFVRNERLNEFPNLAIPGAKIFVQATMGQGGSSRASINPLRRTTLIGQLLPNAGALIPIPNGAVAFNVTTTTVGGLAALEVTQSLSPANTVAMATTTNPQFDIGFGAVPLVSGCRGLEVFNTAAANADGVRVVFTLAF